MSESTLYATGSNNIIAGGMFLVSPIVTAGQESLLQIRDLLQMDLQVADSTPVYDMAILFSAFYSASDKAAEMICKAFAALIRENTQRPEIRAKTTGSLSSEIRGESFSKFDEVLRRYAATMQQLGIELGSRSIIGAATNGALLGGSLDHHITGNAGKTGALVGALIYASVENAQQERLRQSLINCAVEGIHDLVSTIPQLSDTLMDHYATLIFGSDIDFKQRDVAIERANEELNVIAQTIGVLLRDICSYSQTSRKIEAAIERKVFLTRGKYSDIRDYIPFGSIFYSAFWKRFRKNPTKSLFGFMFDPNGGKFKLRAALQKELEPELIEYRQRMEATIAEIDVLARRPLSIPA